MAEPNQISRKRMRFSSSPPTVILAKSKSQYQRDRYSRSAPAVSHTGNGFRVNHSQTLKGKIESKITRTYPRVTIKDLRLRRVFTPNSISIDWEFKTEESPRNSNVGKEESNASEAEDIIQTTPPDPELLSRVCEEINEAAVKKSVTNLSSKSVIHPCSRAKIFKNPVSFSYKRLLPYLMQAAEDGLSSKPEKSFGQTPPNINLSCNKETEETKNVGVEDPKEEAKCQLPVSLSVDIVLNKRPAGSLCGNTSPLKKVVPSSPIKKSVCSRRRLFKTPGSFNYRRMLPYLRDIQENNNPCEPETVSHPDQQKNTEENAPSSMSVCENEGTQEMVTSNVARESDISSNQSEEPLPSECVLVSSPERSDPETEQETQVKHVIPDTEKNLETPDNVLGWEVSLSSPLVGSKSSSEVATSTLNNTFTDTLVSEENMNGAEKTEAKAASTEQLEACSSNLTTEMLDPSVVLGTPPSISPSKGILKRSIRGCRGICSCLNCSSFRLNAERAFEFSRNQLQDTEVMVLDLVGEISRLRDMLEKADHNDSYKSQAGEAAKRASEAAELAKSRLHQMNDDLQVHCRIPNEQRARVKFAHYVHEKTILKAPKPNKLSP